MKAWLTGLRNACHTAQDLLWYGLPCRCASHVRVVRVPSSPLLASALPWDKPVPWTRARETVAEILIQMAPVDIARVEPATSAALLLRYCTQSHRLLETGLQEGSLVLVAQPG